MSEGSLIRGGGELVLDDLRSGLHVGEGTWRQSESVVGAKESSHERLAFGLVDLASAVVVVFLPEVVEVSSHIGVNLIVLHDVELANDVGSPLRSGGLGQLPDT